MFAMGLSSPHSIKGDIIGYAVSPLIRTGVKHGKVLTK